MAWACGPPVASIVRPHTGSLQIAQNRQLQTARGRRKRSSNASSLYTVGAPSTPNYSRKLACAPTLKSRSRFGRRPGREPRTRLCKRPARTERSARCTEGLARAPSTKAICRSSSDTTSSMMQGPGAGRKNKIEMLTRKREREDDGALDGSVSSATRRRRAFCGARRAPGAGRLAVWRCIYRAQAPRTGGALVVIVTPAFRTL